LEGGRGKKEEGGRVRFYNSNPTFFSRRKRGGERKEKIEHSVCKGRFFFFLFKHSQKGGEWEELRIPESFSLNPFVRKCEEKKKKGGERGRKRPMGGAPLKIFTQRSGGGKGEKGGGSAIRKDFPISSIKRTGKKERRRKGSRPSRLHPLFLSHGGGKKEGGEV